MKKDSDRGGLACAVSVNVAVPPPVLWNVTLDMDHHADFCQGIQSMERIGEREGPPRVGSVWYETRKVKGKGTKKAITQRKTIVPWILMGTRNSFPKVWAFP